jgi:predicted secreted protein
MIKRFFCILLILYVPTVMLWAGDVATFANMGFSDDGRFFFFSQYGYSESQRQVYAQAIFVNTATNKYAPNGFHNHALRSAPQSGDTMDGAFLELVERLASVRNEYRINFANKGRILFASSLMRERALANNTTPSDSLSFRDFQQNRSFQVALNQNVANPLRSTFHIDLTLTSASGEIYKYKIGNPEFSRHVSRYTIDRVIVSPDDSTLIFVVAMRIPTPQSTYDIRYMVEAIQIEP